MNFKLIAFKTEKKTVFINSHILGIDCTTPDIDLIVKIGADFEGLVIVIDRMMPKDFPFQMAIPTDIFQKIESFSLKHDICIDIAIRGVMLAWSMDYDQSGEVMFPLNKFVLQQFSNATLNNNELALMLYLSHKIEVSKFKNSPEIQDVGVEIYGDGLVFMIRQPDGSVVRKII